MTDNPFRHEHSGEPVRERVILSMTAAGNGTEIQIGHVYQAGTMPCPDCGGERESAGCVSLDVFSDGPVRLTPAEALVLANRLTRAANLALETAEDPPDIEPEPEPRLPELSPDARFRLMEWPREED